MPIIGNFNGASIVQLPPSPKPKSVEFKAQEIVAVSTSPFTGQSQVQDWQAGYLQASVTMPPMSFANAQAWVAWMLQLRGMANVFQMGFSDGLKPQASTSLSDRFLLSAVTTDSPGVLQTGYALNTRGWSASQFGLLLPGDWLQIGYRLYRNLDPVNSDSSGRATLNIWPALREPVGDGQRLNVFGTTGLWRLASNTRVWSISEGMVYGFQFDMREAF